MPEPLLCLQIVCLKTCRSLRLLSPSSPLQPAPATPKGLSFTFLSLTLAKRLSLRAILVVSAVLKLAISQQSTPLLRVHCRKCS